MGFLRANCPSCHSTIYFKALKEAQCTNLHYVIQ